MPSLNGEAVLERKCNQREPHDYSYILIHSSDVPRHGVPPRDITMKHRMRCLFEF